MFDIEDINGVIYSYLGVRDVIVLSRITKRIRDRLVDKHHAIYTFLSENIEGGCSVEYISYICCGKFIKDIPTAVSIPSSIPNNMISYGIRLVREISALNASSYVISNNVGCDIYLYIISNKRPLAAYKIVDELRVLTPVSIFRVTNEDMFYAVAYLLVEQIPFHDNHLVMDYHACETILKNFGDCKLDELLGSRRLLEFMAM